MEIDFNRIAVKIGSNVLTRRDGTLDVTRMSALVDQIAELHKAGIEIILVSSGAVASGRSEVHPTKKLDSVDQRQLFSAVGQAKLINRYYELFREHGIPVGQVLTMKENFSTRRHYLNQKNCMTVMLENGVIPIVNENDITLLSLFGLAASCARHEPRFRIGVSQCIVWVPARSCSKSRRGLLQPASPTLLH